MEITLQCANQRDNSIISTRKAAPLWRNRAGATTSQIVLAHDLINKLAIIVGQCDLLVEKTPKDSPLFKQTLLVRDLAKAVGSELGQLQCDLARLRTTNGPDTHKRIPS